MNQSNDRIRFGMDFITLYRGSLWGLDDPRAVYSRDALAPDEFWDRALDMIGETGIEGVEITVGLSDWRNALKRYSSPEGFVSALGNRKLELCSGFFGAFYEGWQSPEQQEAMIREATDYAAFLREAGATTMVVGLPPRALWDSPDQFFVDGDYARRLADLLNRLGLATRREGVRLALHPGAGSVFWLRRDIDLFLSLTDPVYIDFCPDTAQIFVGGTNPIDVLEDHYPRVAITHWKDVLKASPRHIEMSIEAFHLEMYTTVGTGAVDWQGWGRTLRDVGYGGWAILEVDAAEDPVAELTAARKFAETSVLPLFGASSRNGGGLESRKDR